MDINVWTESRSFVLKSFNVRCRQFWNRIYCILETTGVSDYQTEVMWKRFIRWMGMHANSIIKHLNSSKIQLKNIRAIWVFYNWVCMHLHSRDKSLYFTYCCLVLTPWMNVHYSYLNLQGFMTVRFNNSISKF